METICILFGTSGEYSDKSTWPIACGSRDTMEALAVECLGRRKALHEEHMDVVVEPEEGADDWTEEQWEAVQTLEADFKASLKDGRRTHPDPSFRVDFNDPHCYFVVHDVPVHLVPER